MIAGIGAVDRIEGAAPVGPRADDEVLSALCAALFASLPRADQRRRGADYVRGLLHVPGRKSIRNIASLLGGGAAVEQRLHHFVCGSTWRWDPVRVALARHAARAAPPSAWVVRPMSIPKSGGGAVGVERCGSPAFYTQRAMGVWLASETAAYPVNWRLLLSRAWLEDRVRRTQASVPDSARPETPGTCAVEACLGLARAGRLPPRPVVMDARRMDAVAVSGRLSAAGLPHLLRVDGALPLAAADPALDAYHGAPLPAERLMRAAARMRRPFRWSGSGPGGLAAAARVRLPERRAGAVGARHGDLALVGVAGPGQRWPGELWLTDVPAPAPELARLTRLVQRVGREFAEVGDRVGIRDFVGRSFAGWHRHITLASAAHAVTVLSRPTAAGELAAAS
ncbi:IS701 family transposase [Streptomyces marincola]|uniref:IS701 family transposase n=1 Tax=Streptomyces marincola TaxID=2878388 RepID=UPI001CF0F4C6|nr:transposase [Streptomyces marincola]UCM90473.1 transposase [Streptomyces marincola]